jgi:hypothetical protein
MFDDVLKDIQPHLVQQREELRALKAAGAVDATPSPLAQKA